MNTHRGHVDSLLDGTALNHVKPCTPLAICSRSPVFMTALAANRLLCEYFFSVLTP